MSKFKAAIVIVAVAAFFGLCVWLSPNLFGNRIRTELTKDSILKYDAGAKVYIASKDDNSKVFFGQSGKYRFYGTGALTMMESPNSTYSNFRSGFNLLIEGGNLELKTGQADILTGSVSPNAQFLALLKIDGKLSIYEIATGKTTYESKDNFVFCNPLIDNSMDYPYFFWTDQGLIVQKNDSLSSENKDLEIFPWQFDNVAWGRYTAKNDQIKKYYSSLSIISIDPATGNENEIPKKNLDNSVVYIIGTIDSNELLCITKNEKNMISKNLFSFTVATSELRELSETNYNYVSYSANKLFHILAKTLVYTSITTKSLSTPAKVNFPKLDGEQISIENIEDLRVTSKGYLYFRHIKTAKIYLLEPVSGVYVEIPKERYPY